AKGEGAVQDYKESVKWYRKAAEQGHAKAQYSLGFMYGNGQGVIKDHLHAYMWLDLSASNGEKLGNKGRDLTAKEMTPVQISKAKNMVKDCKNKKYKNCD
ncbi:MAG: sel1 repeat family protein, partial [Porticoccaceae bacterium]|nr:sel1 repeat family protein [Porticoccaceae bacterium]